MNVRHSIRLQDSLTLIDIHKTGHQRPGDILFEENGRPQTQSIGQRSPKASKKGKTGLFRSKEKVNHRFSHLLPFIFCNLIVSRFIIFEFFFQCQVIKK